MRRGSSPSMYASLCTPGSLICAPGSLICAPGSLSCAPRWVYFFLCAPRWVYLPMCTMVGIPSTVPWWVSQYCTMVGMYLRCVQRWVCTLRCVQRWVYPPWYAPPCTLVGILSLVCSTLYIHRVGRGAGTTPRYIPTLHTLGIPPSLRCTMPVVRMPGLR